MKLVKKLGRIGFLVGFLGPVLFYGSKQLVMAFQFACPLCPTYMVAFWGPLDWLQLGLTFGLVQGLAFALLGFAIGYAISRIRRPSEISKRPLSKAAKTAG